VQGNAMFKFGFGESDSSQQGPSVYEDEENAKSAWLVPVPAPVSAAGDPALTDDAVAVGIPDVFDVVEFAHGGVHLRKSAATAPPAALAPPESDLVPGTYEGGYKLWECAGDLICFLHRTLREKLKDASVLELGAGHALPAMFAAQAGAAVVDVADFNEHVLSDVTATNFRLNCDADMVGRIRMVAGDWGGISAALGGEEYDFVLASEVVYSVGSLARLARCVLTMLRVGGTALVAGKSYYFGVGGGMRAFEKAVHAAAAAADVSVEVDVAEEIRDGKSNVREILRIIKVASRERP
jgi:predicted nicotinamide N-methyase